MLTIRNLYSKILQDKGNSKINPYDENGDLSDILDQIKVRIEDLYDIL